MVKTFTLGRPERCRGRLMINAIGTYERMGVAAGETQMINGHENLMRIGNDSGSTSTIGSESPSSCGDSEEMDDREKLRRLRISKANKGNTPWNKGRKHTPETIQRIKEKTRLAMRDPKVKMKLVTLGHAQSEETKAKIGVGVRLGWERRREKLLLQETCLYEWQNLIAGVARKGLLGEEELQWNSFEIQSKQLQLEWVESVEKRKATPRPKGNKRAPKSAEQKRRISEAIAAKWADPEYRSRVCSGLAKYHGIPEEAERRPRRRPSAGIQDSSKTRTKKDVAVVQKKEMPSTAVNIAPKRRKAPSYSDPQANDKLEMLKSIKAQRAAAMNKGNEAVSRARLLIAEAEKAAKALEIAAMKSPVAYSSLMESRKLIAEAIEVIEALENAEMTTSNKDLPQPSYHSDEGTPELEPIKNEKVNGVESKPSLGNKTEVNDLRLKNPKVDLVNGKASSLWAPGEDQHLGKHCNGFHNYSVASESMNLSVNGVEAQSASTESSKKLVKKWVRGRLVEVEEEP